MAPTEQLLSEWRVARCAPTDGDTPPALDGLEWLPARVPGAVHYDLVAAGRLENPFASTADAANARWVADADWLYATEFDAPEFDAPGFDATGITADGEPVLLLDGVDTFADVWLNGVLVGRTANAYRCYRFPVAGLLRAHGNELLVHVKGHRRMIAEQEAEARERIVVQGGGDERMVKALVRRYQRNSFAMSSLLNLGVHVLGMGITKPVVLRAEPAPRVTGARARVLSLDAAGADVELDVRVEGTGHSGELTVEVTLLDGDTEVARSSGPLSGEEARLPLRVANPKLWWPRGYGEAFRYEMVVRLLRGGEPVHQHRAQTGLRQVELVREEHGAPAFVLRVNGQRVYVRGTNFVPVDYLSVHGEWAVYERLFTLMEHADYNLVRLWGGGAVEDARLYERCDELGIMVWQDFFLHSNTYPDYDGSFVAEFRAEARELVLRLRDHPCLVLLCGGNEQYEGWDEWNWKADVDRFYGMTLARDVAGAVAAELCPELPFIENSPHGGHWAQSPVAGDTHTWGNFFNATKDPLFVTETCWTTESYSRPETLAETMGLNVDDLAGPGWRQEWSRITSLPLITKFPYSSCHGSASLREYLRGLEIEHAMADYHGLGMLRLRSSSCGGIVYWSLNKGGPLFPFGCVDYGGYPMLNYYVVNRMLATLAIGVYRDIDDVRVVVSNAGAQDADFTVVLSHVGPSGEIVHEQRVAVHAAAGELTRALDLPGYYRRIGDRTREAVHAELLDGDGRTLARDTLYFCPVTEFRPSAAPPEPVLTKVAEGRWELELKSTGMAGIVLLDGNQKFLFTDNVFSLVPGQHRSIGITLLDRTSGAAPELSISTVDRADRRSYPLD